MPKILLIVLDGFGNGKDYPFNAIKNAKMPFYKELCKKFPFSELLTCGEAVGLPKGVMGNSEVGHTNMGAGRIVYQELTRIQKSIREKDFFSNRELKTAIDLVAKKSGARLHLMGLLSDAGVHSHLDHLKALVEMASKKVPVTIHAFTDGRDTPPKSGVLYLKELGEFLRQYPEVVMGSVSGRYYAMDRDNRWDRIEKAYRVLTGSVSHSDKIQTKGNGIGAALQILDESYAKGVTDEFIVPHLIASNVGRSEVRDGDGMVFFNFRADRARQITRAFTENSFTEFKVEQNKLAAYVCFTQYDKKFPLPVAFAPQNLERILPDLLSEKGFRQFRIAETEKYAHVTFFFNGGREAAYPMEDRVLVPSPKDVATYDLKPEMSAFEVTSKLATALTAGEHEFALVNYANPDMVGHTGNYDAALKALVAVDQCLEQVVKAALASDYHVLITADHGNIEEMRDDHDEIHTQHTLNPVPFHFISKTLKPKLKDGILADVAPTILDVLNFPKPHEMTGQTLFKDKLR